MNQAWYNVASTSARLEDADNGPERGPAFSPSSEITFSIRNAALKQQRVIYRYSDMSIQFEIPRLLWPTPKRGAILENAPLVLYPVSGIGYIGTSAHDEGRICAWTDARGVRAYTRPRAVSRQPPALLHHVPPSRSRTYTCSLLFLSLFLSLYSLLLTDRPTDQPTNRSNPIDPSADITPRLTDRYIVASKVNKIVLRNRRRHRRG